MKKIKIIMGIAWAFVALVLIIILFPGIPGFSGALSKLSFMKINPRYSGGEVAYQAINPGCTLVVRKPVFEGLIKERKTGFVQIDWKGNLPEVIIDTIDYNSDGSPDFAVNIDTRNNISELTPRGSNVRNIGVSTSTSFGWALRVNLDKE
jgi:hypothetical protein